MAATHTQDRAPGRKPFIQDPDKHYLKVEVGWADGDGERYDDLMAEVLPDGTPKYEDVGFVPGVCGSRRQHLLMCSAATHMMDLRRGRSESEQKAMEGATLDPGKAKGARMDPVEKSPAPRRIQDLTPTDDPQTFREDD